MLGRDEPLFAHANGTTYTRSQVRCLFKSAAMAIGMESKDFGGHSCAREDGTRPSMQHARIHPFCDTGFEPLSPMWKHRKGPYVATSDPMRPIVRFERL